MIARIGIAALGVVLVIAAIIFWDELQYRRRPLGVPEQAVRIDAKGWRSWIYCTPSTASEPNTCSIYRAKSGELALKGQFFLQAQGRGARADELQIDWFDGTAIRLKNGEHLEPVAAPKR